MLRLFSTISRSIVAIVFIFSGFVKLIDPYGTAYKIMDYIDVAGVALPFGAALSFSVFQSVVEFVLGMNALFKVSYSKTVKWLFAAMLFFTGLTLYIAIANPVKDCGCFGDAWLISNWQTFGKNVVLLLLVVEMLRNRYYGRTALSKGKQKMLLLGFAGFAVLFALFAIRHLPFWDFRPYAVGTHIPEQMKVSDDLPKDVYETTFIYEKDGVHEEFDEGNYPWQDSSWTHVDTRNVLISKGAEAPIHDFELMHIERGDITEEVLSNEWYTFCLIAPKLEKTSLTHKEEIEETMRYCREMGFDFFVLTSSVGEQVQTFAAQFSSPPEFCNVDETTLKTIIRAQPGLLVLRAGTILGKFHHRDIPKWGESPDPLTIILMQKEAQRRWTFVLLLVLVWGVVFWAVSRRKRS